MPSNSVLFAAMLLVVACAASPIRTMSYQEFSQQVERPPLEIGIEQAHDVNQDLVRAGIKQGQADGDTLYLIRVVRSPTHHYYVFATKYIEDRNVVFVSANNRNFAYRFIYSDA